MKKTIFFMVAIMLCFVIFFCGCSQKIAEVDTKEAFCRILCLKDDGIVVWIENIGNVYVKNVDSSLEIDPLDTVVMEFSENDLESASGKFIDYFAEELSYSYVIENPKNIRHTTEEEPTFG